MQRIEPRDACHQKAAIVLAYPFGKSTTIDVRHYEAAEHKEHVDSEIALADEIAVRSYVKIGEKLSVPAIMVKNHPNAAKPRRGVNEES